MNYIYITYDAITEFASDRFFQSAEYSESIMLCNILRGKEEKWQHNKIILQHKTSHFFTESSNSYILLQYFQFSDFRLYQGAMVKYLFLTVKL